MGIYENIKEIAKEHGMSIKDVAEKAGIGENSIYRWQNTSASTASLNKVAKALHVHVEDLINRFFISKSLIKPVFILYSVQHLCITLPYFRFLPSLLYTS